jgi:NAD(P)-dependent dehydrogenase (short-subunit alcohol dehydrogenase family)
MAASRASAQRGGGARIAVVTGASAGIGRATALALAERGWHLALLARGTAGLTGARRDVEARGGRAETFEVDVAFHNEVAEAAHAIERELGPVELWVNNAMATVFGRFMDIEPKDFARVTDVTYLGSVNGTRAALELMLPRDRGTIVQIGSGIAMRGIPLQTPYSGAKHAIEGFVEAVREELIHERSSVRLSMVHLPAMNTPQFEHGKVLMGRQPQPVPPIVQPEVAGAAVAWIADHPRKELWVDRSTVMLALAERLAPRMLDRSVARRGWNGQLTDEAYVPRPDNLWGPLDRDLGMHGPFDAVAKDRRVQLWLAKRRRELAGVALVASAVVLWARRRSA